MTVKCFFLVLQVLVLLNCQSPLPAISWRIPNIIDTDNWQFKRTRNPENETNNFSRCFSKSCHDKLDRDSWSCLFCSPGFLVLLNCQYPLPPINCCIPYIIAVKNWQFKKTRTRRTRQTALALSLLGCAALNWIIDSQSCRSCYPYFHRPKLSVSITTDLQLASSEYYRRGELTF